MELHNHPLPPAQPATNTHRRSVFICSPFAGDIASNTRRAIRYTRFAITNGYVPFTPHLLYPQVLDEHDPCERELGLHLGLCWLDRCDEIWVFGSRITAGMERELIKAKRLNMRVRWFTEVCTEITDL